MKEGLSIQNLAAELERRVPLKNDFIVNTNEIGFDKEEGTNKWEMTIPEQGSFEVSENTHNQLSQRIKIPKKYYNRMMVDAPDLLIQNVRHWFDNEAEPRMVRTLENDARAFLSNRYRRIDNEQIAEVALPALLARKDAVVLSSNVTENKMYIKVIFTDMKLDVLEGDTVYPGLIITNSEIGKGALDVQYFFYRSFCTNGCVFGKSDIFGMKKYHTGSKIEGTEGYQIFSDETQKLDDNLMLSQVKDLVKAATSFDLFETHVNKLRVAADSSKMVNPIAGVEVLAKAMDFSETEKDSVLQNLLEDRDYSKWGALNAVTKVANSHDDYDRASEFEAMGGKVLELPNSMWNTIATAEKVAA